MVRALAIFVIVSRRPSPSSPTRCLPIRRSKSARATISSELALPRLPEPVDRRQRRAARARSAPLVRERLKAGDTDAQVMRFVEDRYGEFVLLNPRFELSTLLLWLTPVLVFCLPD